MIHCLLFPFKRFDHADDVCAEIVVHGSERIGVRRAVTIDRGAEEMARGVGYEELAGRSCISLKWRVESVTKNWQDEAVFPSKSKRTPYTCASGWLYSLSGIALAKEAFR